MAIPDIIKVLIAIYIAWAVIYSIIWGVVFHKKKFDTMMGGKASAKWFFTAILSGIYPLVIAAGLYIFEIGNYPSVSLTPETAGETSLHSLFSSLLIPTVVLAFIVSALCNNSFAIARFNYNAYKKKVCWRAGLSYGSGILMNLGLLGMAAWYLFAGERNLAAWILWADSIAYLLVRLVHAPSGWTIMLADFVSKNMLFYILIIVLRLGIIVLGGWFVLGFFLRFPTDPGFHILGRTVILPAIWGPMVSVVIPATVLTIGSFLIVRLMGYRMISLKTKVRPWTLSLLLFFSGLVPLLVFLNGPIQVFGTGLLAFGLLYGFFFFGMAPKPTNIKQIFGWIWFYSAVSGATFLAFSVSRTLQGANATLYMPVLLLYILFAGLAEGANARILVSKHYVRSYYDH